MPERRPLIVRLRHWVGDVVLSVPTLQRLESAGYELHLIGKGFAPQLLAGFGWTVHRLAPTLRERVAQLRALRASLTPQAGSRTRRPEAIVFPYSFSSALEARLAGLKACGFATEGRSLLLGSTLPRPRTGHTLEEYWSLGSAFLNEDMPAPQAVKWQTTPEAQEQAKTLLAQAGLTRANSPGFILAVPYASGTYGGQSKHWPGFDSWLRQAWQSTGCMTLLCPGPGEEQQVRSDDAAHVRVLPGVDLGVFAALAEHARLVISNDTGPGHLAAATGTLTLSILGPTDASRWAIRGARGHTLQTAQGWPSVDEVRAAIEGMMRSDHRLPS
ncbi:MAG: glycosyltransferase family 9 protein [Burkholderiaceae bacterium]